ncbi:MAG: peptide transporter, partial [Verrucomicrobiia bacterium]
MTYKFVGAIKGITTSQPHVMKALWLGIGIGLAIEVTRKLIKRTAGYQAFVARSKAGRATDFTVDAVLLPSPYASSFGGFVELPTVLWWAGGGIFGSLYTSWSDRRKKAADANALPADMSTMSLVGGGLIAGDSLAALSVGVYGLLKTVL